MERVQEFWDDATKTLYRKRTVDVGPNITKIRRERNEDGHNNGFTRKRTMRRIGEIPMIEIGKMYARGINPFRPENAQAVKKWLDENPAFRTVDKPVSY